MSPRYLCYSHDSKIFPNVITHDRLVEGEIFFVAKAETADQMILHLSVILQELFKVSKPIPMSLRLVVLRLKSLSPKALLSGIVYWQQFCTYRWNFL